MTVSLLMSALTFEVNHFLQQGLEQALKICLNNNSAFYFGISNGERLMNRFRTMILTAVSLLSVILLSERGNKVITVADIQEAEEQTAEYIELQEFELKEIEEKNGRESVQYCAVMIPAGYKESEEIPGMYLHERAPLDSSNVYYSVSEGVGDGAVSESLTKEAYEKSIEDAFKESGQDINLTVAAFEEVDMDGVPAYKIRSSYETGENTVGLTYLFDFGTGHLYDYLQSG